MSNIQETTLEINLAHLSHNFRYIKSKIANGVKMLAVVKASGYGSDAIVIAKHLEKIGADYLAVAYTAEGIALREAQVQIPILVLHPQPVNFSKLIEHRLEPNVYSFRTLQHFIKAATALHQTDYPVHIKFNTGLNRIGFSNNDIPLILSEIDQSQALKIVALLSHLAASEDHDEKDFTTTQIKTFQEIADKMNVGLGYRPMLHLSNTSGILNYQKAHFDMVRSGIGLYGYGNEAKYDQALKPVASLKSVISQIHILAPGDSLGYNRAFKATDTTKTATIPIGHADGISRNFGKANGFVTIGQQRAYILGNVCMDMIMVDVTQIDCQEGDEVVIFDATTNAAQVAEFSGTISYELLTAVSSRVKRVVIADKL
ncbi:alanine racemase [Aquimarina sp. U1-2]|uniref:alanine racemase n=1 Tax=Aquimarina sp. U1-2 TaxID=2823141 RepID=UPI001AEC970B|nr:alanine racemase [Aquimarina sp. U1-2]MBP2831200.1 alanine racemase [Aquimarina sp. U1-2]